MAALQRRVEQLERSHGVLRLDQAPGAGECRTCATAIACQPDGGPGDGPDDGGPLDPPTCPECGAATGAWRKIVGVSAADIIGPLADT